MFALGPGGAERPWPRCGQNRSDMWECLGVPLEEPVVLVAPSETEVGWAIASAQSVTNQEVHMTRAKWGRLLHVINPELTGAVDAIVTPWREARRADEPDRLRIRLKPDESVDVYPLAAGTWWIAGTNAGPNQDRFLEVSSPTTSAHRVPVLDLLSHPFDQTYTVALEPQIGTRSYTAARRILLAAVRNRMLLLLTFVTLILSGLVMPDVYADLLQGLRDNPGIGGGLLALLALIGVWIDKR